MRIVIPSIGRSHDTRAIREVLASGYPVDVVTFPEQRKDYEAALVDVNVFIYTPKKIKGIALTRQWIIDNVGLIDNKVVMMDDDVRFFRRRDDEPTKFLRATALDLKRFLRHTENALDKYAHTSIVPKQGGNRILADQVCGRPSHVFGYNVSKFKEARAKYNDGMVQDDFDVTLQLLRAGLPNLVISGWAVDQYGGHGAPGGTSSYRTVESHNASVQRLAKMHAPYVRVVQKNYSSVKMLGDYANRLECVISWKKAYADARR